MGSKRESGRGKRKGKGWKGVWKGKKIKEKGMKNKGKGKMNMKKSKKEMMTTNSEVSEDMKTTMRTRSYKGVINKRAEAKFDTQMGEINRCLGDPRFRNSTIGWPRQTSMGRGPKIVNNACNLAVMVAAKKHVNWNGTVTTKHAKGDKIEYIEAIAYEENIGIVN